MLLAQAHTLSQVFYRLTVAAYTNQDAGYLEAMDRFLRLALKAQSQCRTTLQTLSDIKNPKAVAFIRQANVAQNQQINNGEATPAPARAEKTESRPNELIQVTNDAQAMDPRGTGATSKADPAMATVEPIDGAANRRREEAIQPERMEGRSPSP
jgi:hypothetical protein